MSACRKCHERRTTVFRMLNLPTTTTLARLAGCESAANPGAAIRALRSPIPVALGDRVDTWDRRPASIAA